jgi:hypothetical protein
VYDKLSPVNGGIVVELFTQSWSTSADGYVVLEALLRYHIEGGGRLRLGRLKLGRHFRHYRCLRKVTPTLLVPITKLLTMAALVNVWHLRKVAEASAKPCDICYKPTTSVLITPDNKVGMNPTSTVLG